jgi:hypothetical protein
LYDEYGEPQSPYINIANDALREDPGSQSRVSRDPIPLFFLSLQVDEALTNHSGYFWISSEQREL